MGKWRRDNFIEATFFWVSRFFSDMGRSKNFTKCSERKSKDSKQAVQYGIFKSGKCLQRGKKDKKKLFPLTKSSIIQPTEPTDGIVLWSSGKMWYAYTKQIFFFLKKGEKDSFCSLRFITHESFGHKRFLHKFTRKMSSKIKRSQLSWVFRWPAHIQKQRPLVRQHSTK